MNNTILNYIARIHNQPKRAYADAYYKAKIHGLTAPSSDAYAINYMAAQAVRMRINELLPMAKVGQKPLDIGLFSDDSLQTDLIEMLVDPID